MGGVQQLAQLPETGVDLRVEIGDLQLPLGGIRQLFGAKAHCADGVQNQIFRTGFVCFVAVLHE